MVTYEYVKDAVNHPEIYIIDVRGRDEIASTGMIPGSINIPLSELDAALELTNDDFDMQFKRPKPSKDATIIFSCLKGGRAQKAATLAQNKGYKNAKPYLGSWSEWAQKEGL